MSALAHAIGCAWMIALVLPAMGAAQELIVGPAQVQPQVAAVSPADAAPSSGVYVHDSALAMDRMALAERLQNLKEWGKSADIYQEIVEKYHDRVVPSHVDDSGTVDQYTSVLSLVTDRLRAWPPEGLAVYRARYELTAENLVRAADNDNLAPLHEAFSRYFVTDGGKAAGIKLIDAYFERGDFPAAAWIAQALLVHPDLDADRPRVLFRAGLAGHFSGDEASAQAALDELMNHFATAIATIGGRDVNLADELKSALARPVSADATAAGGVADDSWPMPGGGPSRGKVSFSTAQPGARLYSIELPQPDWKGLRMDANQRKALEDQEEPWRREGKDLGIIPVADRGELFFQDNLHVYAVDMETGQPLPGWLAAQPSQNGQYTLSNDPNALAMPIGYQLSLTLTDRAVLAVMGLPDPLAVAYSAADERDGEVVCLDRRNGRENWTFAAHDLPDDALRTLRFGGSPLVAGNNVFLSAFSNKGNGYEDCYVICLDLQSGKYRWTCYIAGAPDAGQTIQNAQGQITSLMDVPTHLAYASGRVYVATNEGAVAALDAYSGTIAWLNIYREADEAVNPNAMPLMMRGWNGGFRGGFGGPMMPGAPWTPPAPWAANAPIMRDGDLFVLPADGRYVLVYDAGDGHILKKLRKSDCCIGVGDEGADMSAATPDALLGVLDGAEVLDGGREQRKDILLLATPDRVCAIKWREYDPDHPSSAIEWASAHDPGESLRGRAFVTADSAYIPMVQKLSRVAVRTGLIVQTYPAEGNAPASDSDSASAWPAGEGPGNVLVCGDDVVIAGDRSVSVYSDLSLARVRLEKEVAEAPADPNARLHYAEVMFRGNQSATAARKLDEAMQLLAAQDAAAAHDRAFNDAMEFAVKSGGAAEAAGFFDRAASLAHWPGQQVSYRLKRARFDRADPRGDLGAAIELYQEILADNSLRTAPAGPESAESAAAAMGSVSPDEQEPEMAQAGVVAQHEIDAIMHTPAGAAAYQPFERAAAAEFAAAQSAKDAVRLAAIADDYPNSSVAQRAQLAAADAFAVRGESRPAARELRDLYPRLTDPAQRRLVLTAMARNYLKMPGRLAAAAGRLAVAAQIDGSQKLLGPLVLPGRTLAAGTTLAEAAAVLSTAAEEAPPREVDLPSFGFPSRAVERDYHDRYQRMADPFASGETKIGDVGKLLAPEADFARYDRVVTWTAGRGLSIYGAADGKLVGTDSDLSDEPRGAAWVEHGKDLLVWTGGQVILVGGDTASGRWKASLGGMGELDVLSQPAPEANINLIQEMDPRLLNRNRRQNLIPVRERPFMARPLPPAEDEAVGSPDESATGGEGEWVAGVDPIGDLALVRTTTGRVAALRLEDGAIAWQVRPSARAADRAVATEDFTVIETTDESMVQLLVLDTSSGRFLARKLFSIQEGDAPVNLALADDGTFAYSTEDRILIHDLFEAAGDPSLNRPRAIVDASPDKPFIDMARPDQFLLRGGTILAVTDNGVTVRGYSAQTGQLREFTQDSRLAPMVLPTGEHTDQAGMCLGDRYVYTWGPGSMAAYNLDHPEASWDPADLTAAGAVRQILLGRDYLVLLSQPSDSADEATAWVMSAFSRALVPGKQTESGLLRFQTQLTDPQGIVAWQGIAGGLCYLSGDHTLHLLQGNTNPAPPP